MRRTVNVLFLLVALLALTSCYYDFRQGRNLSSYTERQIDSLSFYGSHHYTNNYNFVVSADSIILLRQQPEEILGNLSVDTVTVKRHDHLVVADIRILPADSTDSVWVQVARDQMTFGWTHESSLLPRVVPDDPISQFISTFSDQHLIYFLVVIAVIGTIYLMRVILSKRARIVHLHDIASFYPTLLALIVAFSATLYASIQLYVPETWEHFYFHPTLNPFSTPPLLSVFLISVWAMLIVAVAVLDDVRRHLPFGEAVLYLCGLAAVCAIDYIVFSLTTLFYVGYALLAAYVCYALMRYFRHSRFRYLCGSCGRELQEKGCCPHCGALNE